MLCTLIIYLNEGTFNHLLEGIFAGKKAVFPKGEMPCYFFSEKENIEDDGLAASPESEVHVMFQALMYIFVKLP